ncbi:hypothetical protein [Streptacidiphilus sp. EB129]|jgi:hypothetical protein|uniref:hypothetical protein n=1 Tax=Streptacidiphilus sp. EB129 TaxID=3156262 RepID=UPI003516F210
MSGIDIQYQSAKFREIELRRAAEHFRLVAEAERAAKSERAEARRQKGGADHSHLRGVRRFRRASVPSGC